MAVVVDRSENRLTRFLDLLIAEHRLQFRHWLFGHCHRDMDQDRFSLVFNRICKVEWDV